MRKILLLARCPPYPLQFGDRLILWHMSRHLARRGYTLDLLALYNRPEDPQHIDEYRHFYRHIELIREPPRRLPALLWRALVPGRRFARSAGSSLCPPLWRALARHLERAEVDIVHGFGSVSIYEYQPLFAQLPALICPYESYTLYLQRAAEQGQLRAWLMLPLVRHYERFMYERYGRTVVISDVDREALLALNPQLQVEVIPNGIDLERFRSQPLRRDEATLLFVGNYDYAPNRAAARLLVERILPAVRRQLPQTRLQLVGFNPPSWLRDCAGEAIEVTGSVPDVAPYLARASVFVCPLQVGAGMKNKVLEALAMGIPVLGTPLSFDGIHIRPGADAIVSDLEQMPEATIRLLEDSAKCQELAAAGPALVRARYSWEWVASRYERLYDELCGAPR